MPFELKSLERDSVPDEDGYLFVESLYCDVGESGKNKGNKQ